MYRSARLLRLDARSATSPVPHTLGKVNQMGTPKLTPADGQNGIETVASSRPFTESIAHFELLLAARGLILFAKVDFTSDAKDAGIDMPPTMLLIFGNPKAGTPLMIAAPSAALDFPLKVLVSQDSDRRVWFSYNTPEYLAERHGIPGDLVKNIAGVRALVQAATATASDSGTTQERRR